MSKERESLGTTHWECIFGFLDLLGPPELLSTTKLYDAADKGNVENLAALLKSGEDIEGQAGNGRTALFIAAYNGYEECVSFLLEKGAKIETQDHWHQTPLSCAASHGHEECVRVLLKAGANLEARGECERTPLTFAAHNNHAECVRILLKAGANLEARDEFGYTPFHLMFETGTTQEMIILLLNSGADVLSKNIEGKDIFHSGYLWNILPQESKDVLEFARDIRAIDFADLDQDTVNQEFTKSLELGVNVAFTACFKSGAEDKVINFVHHHIQHSDSAAIEKICDLIAHDSELLNVVFAQEAKIFVEMRKILASYNDSVANDAPLCGAGGDAGAGAFSSTEGHDTPLSGEGDAVGDAAL